MTLHHPTKTSREAQIAVLNGIMMPGFVEIDTEINDFEVSHRPIPVI